MYCGRADVLTEIRDVVLVDSEWQPTRKDIARADAAAQCQPRFGQAV